jgi:hypothetical protein
LPRGQQISPGTRQILDTAQVSTAIVAASNGSAGVSATPWPILPNQTLKVYNVSAFFTPDTDLVITPYSIFIAMEFLDGSQNPIQNAGGDNLLLVLAWWNAGGSAPAPSLLSDDGYVCSAAADPLIEIASNMLIANIPNVGAGASFIRIVCNLDATNTDAVNNHTIDVDLLALLSFEQRSA